MTFLATPPTEERQQLQLLQQTPSDPDAFKPGFFQGTGTALGVGTGRVLATASQLTNEAGAIPARLLTRPIDDLFGTDLTGFMDQEMVEGSRRLTASLTPDPMTTGTLGRILYGVVGIGVPAAVGGYFGGPAGAAALAGTSTTTGSYADLTQQGVDPDTAAGVSLLEGGFAAAGVAVPASLGGRVALNTLLYGPGINVAQDLAAGQGAAAILEARGYTELADRYAEIDAEMLAADIVLGGAFGWAGARSARVPRGTINTDATDAAHVALDQRHVELDTAPGIPATMAAQQAHVRALTAATEAMLDGRPVEAKAEGAFVPKPANPAYRDSALVTAMRESGLPGLMDEIAGLEAELAKRGRVVAEEPLPDLGAALPPTTEGWTDRGDKQTRANISDSGTERSVGALYFEVRNGPDDRHPLQLWVTRDGKLSTRNKAFSAVVNTENVNLWTDGTPTQKARVLELLRERGEHALGSARRKAIDAEIEAIVTGKKAVDFAHAPTGAKVGHVTDVKIGEEYAAARWAVMEADEVAPTVTVAENQLRDRTRMASQLQVDEMAAKLDPRLLLADVPTMDHGAPTLSADGKVVAGNGRALAVRKAYSGERGAAYRQALVERAAAYGLAPAEIEGMRAPVLVRVLQQGVDVERAAILSNEGGAMRMSGLEQARVDAGRLPSLAAVEVPDSGDFTAASLRDYVRGWVQQFPAGQRAALVDAQGQLSQEGMTRLRNAVLFRAYGDSAVLQRLVESADPGARNVAQALVKAAPKVAEVKDAIARGELHPLDLSDAIVRTADLVEQIRDQGLTVDAWIAQLDLFNPGETPATLALLRFVDANKRSAKAIAEMLNGYYDRVIAAGNPGQGDLLGAGVPDQAAMLDAAIKEAAPAKHAQVVQDTLFRPTEAPPDARDIVNPIDPLATPEQKLAQIKKLTAENKPKVDAFLAKLDRELGTESKSNVKLDDAILAKAQRPSIVARKPWHGVEHLRDTFRFKTVINSVADLPAIAERFAAEGWEVVKIDTDKMLQPKEWGWRIVALDMRLPNGQLVEWYMPLKELEAAKKEGHKIFEKWRNEDAASLSPEKMIEMQADVLRSRELYNEAFNAALARSGHDESAVRASLASFAASASSVTASSSARSAPVNLKAGRFVQRPLTRRAKKPLSSTDTRDPSGDRETAGLSGMGRSSGENIAQEASIAQGAIVAAEKPHMPVASEEGTLPAAEAMLRAEVEEQRAQTDAPGFEAAVNCFLRSGQ